MRMFDILRSATQQKIGVEIKKNTIYFFYDNEILAIETLVDATNPKHEKWNCELYDGEDIINLAEGTKEDIAKQCIQHSIKKRTEMEKRKKFGTIPSKTF